MVADAHSKWIDNAIVSSPTAAATITAMRRVFAVHDIPCVSDNGSCFISKDLTVILETNGVEVVHLSPYHSATNGLAEKAVQTVKQGIACQNKDHSLEERLLAFLFTYRMTTQHYRSCSF